MKSVFYNNLFPLRVLSLISFLLLSGTVVAKQGGEMDIRDLGAIWFVGDSITQGNADDDPNGSPRKALYDLLKAQDYAFSYTGHWKGSVDGLPDSGNALSENLYHFHSGCSGAVIAKPVEKRVGIAQSLPRFWNTGRLAEVKPDVILIMLGSNDIHRNLNCEEAPARMRCLLDTIFNLPNIGSPVVLLGSIPPTAKERAGRDTAVFNAALPGIAAECRAQGRDVRFVDHFAALNSNYSSNIRADHLHPNASGNLVIAREWFKALTVESSRRPRDVASSL